MHGYPAEFDPYRLGGDPLDVNEPLALCGDADLKET
jgi:hypothetical protein